MAMPRAELENLVEDALPGAVCRARDLTGTEDHWGLDVAWSGFRDLPLLDQHRAVLAILAPYLEATGSGVLHAVEIKTRA